MPIAFLSKINFKKLTIVDVVLIGIVLLGAVFIYRFFNSEEQWINAVVLQSNTPLFLSNSYKIGDTEKDSNGTVIAQIINIESQSTALTQSINKDFFFSVKLKVKINPRTRDYEYKNKIIKVASPIDIKSNSGLITGTIISLDQSSVFNKENKTVTLKIYDVYPWYAEAIKVGAFEQDDTLNKIVEVVSKEVSDSEIMTTTSLGSPVKTTNPLKKDILLTIKISVQKFGNDYIFRKDRRVSIGEKIIFSAGDVRITDAFITAIK